MDRDLSGLLGLDHQHREQAGRDSRIGEQPTEGKRRTGVVWGVLEHDRVPREQCRNPEPDDLPVRIVPRRDRQYDSPVTGSVVETVRKSMQYVRIRMRRTGWPLLRRGDSTDPDRGPGVHGAPVPSARLIPSHFR